MFGQVALAQHGAKHIEHDVSFELVSSVGHHYNQKHHEHDKEENHECPECVLVQSLQAAFYNDIKILLLTSQAQSILSTQQSSITLLNRNKAHSPRAPPATLI